MYSQDYPVDFFSILPSVFKCPININNAPQSNGTTTSSDNFSDDLDSSLCLSSSEESSDDCSVVKLSSLFTGEQEETCTKITTALYSTTAKSVLSSSSPTAIRFPTNSRKISRTPEWMCCWSGCTEQISSSSTLIEHLQTKHVNPQTFNETFTCLWTGCKVYNRPSCSRLWLEKHVLCHGGSKPFRCILDGCCGQRFTSQLMLERHIDRLLKKNGNGNSVETSPKLIKRNGQVLRYRRQPFSVRGRTDMFDSGVMSHLQYFLVEMTKNCKQVSLDVVNSKTFLHITFWPKVIGCRTELSGEMKYLVRWYPYNTLDDEWLPFSEAKNTKSVPLWKLPQKTQEPFWNIIFPHRTTKPAHQPRKCKSSPQCTAS